MALGKKSGEAAGSWRETSAGFGTRLCSTFAWLTVSTATFVALTVPRRKEWVDICLDYMYLKRAQYEPNVYQSIGRWLKKVPK